MKNLVFFSTLFFCLFLSVAGFSNCNLISSFEDSEVGYAQEVDSVSLIHLDKATEVAYSSDFLASYLSSSLESYAVESYEALAGECCGTCTVTIGVGFASFSYSWCCNRCKNEQ